MEERYGVSNELPAALSERHYGLWMANILIGGSEPWRRHHYGYKRKQRDIWIRCEVWPMVPHSCGETFSLLTWPPAQAMTASQMRIAETIDAFYGDAGAKDGVSRSYKQAVEDLDAETIKALDGPYRTTVLEPISRFCAYFPDVNECA